MGWLIVHDELEGVAVLVDPAGPWALGPAVQGEHAVATLEAFAEGLDQDVAELTVWEMALVWQQFLAVVGGVAENVPEAAPAAPGAAPSGEGGDSAGPTPAVSPAPVEDAELHAEAVAEHQDAESEARAVLAECRNCRSTDKEVADGVLRCAICGEPAAA